MESSLAGIVNVWLCLAIVLGLFVYRRHGAAHKTDDYLAGVLADARIHHHPVPLLSVHTRTPAGWCGAESGFLCAYRVGAREFVKNPFVTEAST
ncbi:hypothetical protein [Escherichia coli]|uniref:hypothetical protein n=1 Tax=Escherichia coli TaxID=562 RepID=UPI0039A536FB